jgi:hypothetical protein
MRDFLNQQVQSADAKNIQFEARDLDTGDNVDVTVEPREGWPKSLRTLRAELIPIISKAGYTLLTASPRRVKGQKAYELVETVPVQGVGPTVPERTRIGQLLIRHKDGVIEIAVAGADDSTTQALIDSILGSVR